MILFLYMYISTFDISEPRISQTHLFDQLNSKISSFDFKYIFVLYIIYINIYIVINNMYNSITY